MMTELKQEVDNELSSLWKHSSITLITHCTYLQWLNSWKALFYPCMPTWLHLTYLLITLNKYKSNQEGNLQATFYRHNSFKVMTGAFPQLTVQIIGWLNSPTILCRFKNQIAIKPTAVCSLLCHWSLTLSPFWRPPAGRSEKGVKERVVSLIWDI